MELTAEERALLERVKAAKRLVPESETAGRLRSLAERGFLKPASMGRGKAKQPAYSISPQGNRELKPPGKARAKKPAVATTADFAAFEARLLARLDQIAAALGIDAPRPRPAPDLPALIPPAIREVDVNGRHGGVVPIPEVRRVVLHRTGASRDQFDAALLALEREFVVDLKIANETQRPDAADGITVPGRGLVYYALAR